MGFACVVVNIGVFTGGTLLAWQCQKNKLKKYLDKRTESDIVLPCDVRGTALNEGLRTISQSDLLRK
jgi:hypothetical protein